MIEPEYGSSQSAAETDLRELAVRSLRRKQAFKIHALVYTLVNSLLIVVWLATGIASGVWYPWFIFPLFGWGIGLGVQGWTAYRGDELSESRIRAEMNRIAGS
jgi:hypothetical protein